MTSRTLADARGWVATGTALINAQLDTLSEADFTAASGLPGWSRKHLVAHLAGNAAAIGNLVHWAATGQPTPMYTSAEAVPASEAPWMRAREVMIHAVDLQTGVTFDELPSQFLAALCDDIVAKRSAAVDTETEGPALELTATDSPLKWQVAGAGAPTVVSGSLPALAAYLSGRSSGLVVAVGGAVPELPAWL